MSGGMVASVRARIVVVFVAVSIMFSLAIAHAPRAEAAAWSDQLRAGERLRSGQSLVNALGYTLAMQTDGNLVLYVPTSAGATWKWQTGTNGHYGAFAIMQTDGNLVVYSATEVPLWQSGTRGTGTANRLVLQTDGNLVMYSSVGTAKWYTWTFHTPDHDATFSGQFKASLQAYTSYKPDWGLFNRGTIRAWVVPTNCTPNYGYITVDLINATVLTESVEMGKQRILCNTGSWVTWTGVYGGDYRLRFDRIGPAGQDEATKSVVGFVQYVG